MHDRLLLNELLVLLFPPFKSMGGVYQGLRGLSPPPYELRWQ